ncbi:MAG: hypothetical protein JNM21_05110 [Taibaiella sp.]|nr:hypothetical protein [Taibaiella sp.]
MIPQLEDKFKRIFWHEIGHFVAHFFNKEYFGNLGTEIIEITYHPEYNDFTGRLKPKKPLGQEHLEPPLKDYTNFITTIIYGCLFQSIFTNKEFEYCFDYNKSNTNGYDDASKFWDNMRNLKVDKESIYEIVLEHFNIVKESNCLNLLFDSNISSLILSKGQNKYEILLDQLELHIVPFLTELKMLYTNFYKKIYSVVNGIEYCIKTD